MLKYVAFLRGINVGGNKTLKMADLKKAFESLGFKNVKTVLASGNVVFEVESTNENELANKIEQALEKKFEHKIGVIIRSVESLQRLRESDPFGKLSSTEGTTCYVTFLAEKSKGNLKLSLGSADQSIAIICNTGSEVFSYVDLSKDGHTVNLMKILDRQFGSKITTRNWKTIIKIVG